jgi:hypothetical protein
MQHMSRLTCHPSLIRFAASKVRRIVTKTQKIKKKSYLSSFKKKKNCYHGMALHRCAYMQWRRHVGAGQGARPSKNPEKKKKKKKKLLVIF